MLIVKDGYSQREAEEMLGKSVTQVDVDDRNQLVELQSGVVIANDSIEVHSGVHEHCVWIQWDGSDKAVLYGKMNEGKDFQVDGNTRDTKLSKENRAAICPSGMPPSKQQIDAYKKLLSAPSTANAPSPFGTVSKTHDPHRDRKIMASIRSTEAKLSEKRDHAMTSFNSVSNQKHLRQRFNQSSGMGM